MGEAMAEKAFKYFHSSVLSSYFLSSFKQMAKMQPPPHARYSRHTFFPSARTQIQKHYYVSFNYYSH